MKDVIFHGGIMQFNYMMEEHRSLSVEDVKHISNLHNMSAIGKVSKCSICDKNHIIVATTTLSNICWRCYFTIIEK